MRYDNDRLFLSHRPHTSYATASTCTGQPINWHIENAMIRLDSILTTLGSILLGGAVGYFTEPWFDTWIRSICAQNDISFVGKDIRLLPSNVFLIGPGLWTLAFLYLSRSAGSIRRIELFLLSILCFVTSTWTYATHWSIITVLECTACDDGVFLMRYAELESVRFFWVGLILALAPPIVYHIRTHRAQS